MNNPKINSLALLIFSIFIINTSAIGIDDKLDFGSKRKTHTFFRNEGFHKKNSFNPLTHFSDSKKVENSDGFNKIGLVCVNGGCNTTNATDESDNTVKTNVVVHIETKIDKDYSKTKPLDDIPDIPIIIGTDISNSNSYNGFQTAPKSIFKPSIEPYYFQNTRSHAAESNVYPYESKYYTSLPTIPIQTNRGVDSGTLYQDMFNLKPKVDINIKSLPSASIGLSSDVLTIYKKNNGIRLSVPYFDPTLQTHHFRETPPPQYVYYSRGLVNMNPVEFKVTKPSWKPSQWQNQFNQYERRLPPIGKEVKCFCENMASAATDQLYNRESAGFSPNKKVSFNEPGLQINDKLSPLN